MYSMIEQHTHVIESTTTHDTAHGEPNQSVYWYCLSNPIKATCTTKINAFKDHPRDTLHNENHLVHLT